LRSNFSRSLRRGKTIPRAALTEAYARRFEKQIRAAPSDWPWSHKRWKLKKSVYRGRRRIDPVRSPAQ